MDSSRRLRRSRRPVHSSKTWHYWSCRSKCCTSNPPQACQKAAWHNCAKDIASLLLHTIMSCHYWSCESKCCTTTPPPPYYAGKLHDIIESNPSPSLHPKLIFSILFFVNSLLWGILSSDWPVEALRAARLGFKVVWGSTSWRPPVPWYDILCIITWWCMVAWCQ